MKSYIDFFETLKGEFIGSLKFKNKFIRLWGTTTVDGVKVLNSKFYISPGFTTQKVQSLLKHIGSEKDYNSASFEGTTSYYFWLNSSKADTISQDGLNDIIAMKINSYCSIGEKITINLNFSNNDDYNYFKNFTKQQIFDYVSNDYDAMYSTIDNYAVGETLLTSTIGSYILFDKGQHFDITILNASISAVPTKVRINMFDDYYTTVYKAGISLEVQAVRKSSITGSANIVTHIVDEALEYSVEATRLQQLLESNTNESTTSDSIWIKSRTGKTDDIWYKGSMRLSFLNDGSISTKEKIRILMSSFDTGYTQKKTKWYKKILGPVLVIIAIALAIVTAGAGATLSSVLMSIAANVGLATLTMTALSAYWAKHGDPAASQYMGRWIKIGSIVSAVAGIASITLNIARQAATNAAMATASEAAAASATGTATATASYLGQSATVTASASSVGTTTVIGAGTTSGLSASVGFADFVSAGWDSIYGSIAGSAMNTISSGLKLIRFLTNNRFQSQAKSLQSEINAKTEQYDKAQLELEEMNDKEVNIAVEDIKWYTDGLKIQSQVYDVDYLYCGTKFNIGRPSFCTGRGSNIISNDLYDVNKI